MPAYDLVAIDLDGTLLDSKGRISRDNIDAIHAARKAGMTIVICTGRGLPECLFATQAIGQRDPVVVASGAMLACPITTRTLHRFTIRKDTVERGVRTILDHGHSALVLKDHSHVPHDYLVVRGPNQNPIDPVTSWWFAAMGVQVRHVESIAHDEHPEHTIRFGACAPPSRLAEAANDLQSQHGEDVQLHHFPAVVAPSHVAGVGEEALHVLEVFDAQATKWNAVRWLADQRGIAHSRTAAIGDQINDMSMIRGAGLGIAMGNAVDSIKAAAGRETKDHNSSGVAHALSKILEGEW